jgi:hypothetical protein
MAILMVAQGAIGTEQLLLSLPAGATYHNPVACVISNFQTNESRAKTINTRMRKLWWKKYFMDASQRQIVSIKRSSLA